MKPAPRLMIWAKFNIECFDYSVTEKEKICIHIISGI